MCRAQLITAHNLRIDLLFTMSDNLHRGDRNQRGTNSDAWTSSSDSMFGARISTANQNRDAAKAGGARRNRTDDLMLAKHALSQLSYGPGLIGTKRGALRNGGPGKT